jgi:hypothetical protein
VIEDGVQRLLINVLHWDQDTRAPCPGK